MAKVAGAKSSTMGLEMFEALIKVARNHSVDSFSYGDVTVNLGSEYKDTPDPTGNPGGTMHDEMFDPGSNGTDNLITNPLMRG